MTHKHLGPPLKKVTRDMCSPVFTAKSNTHTVSAADMPISALFTYVSSAQYGCVYGSFILSSPHQHHALQYVVDVGLQCNVHGSVHRESNTVVLTDFVYCIFG